VDAEATDLGLRDALGRVLGAAGEVADVPEAGHDRVAVTAQEAGDRLGLGAGLHDHEWFGHVTVLRDPRDGDGGQADQCGRPGGVGWVSAPDSGAVNRPCQLRVVPEDDGRAVYPAPSWPSCTCSRPFSRSAWIPRRSSTT